MPTTKLYTAATTAASVGVKMPNFMPPRITTGSASARLPCAVMRRRSPIETRGAGRT